MMLAGLNVADRHVLELARMLRNAAGSVIAARLENGYENQVRLSRSSTSVQWAEAFFAYKSTYAGMVASGTAGSLKTKYDSGLKVDNSAGNHGIRLVGPDIDSYCFEAQLAYGTTEFAYWPWR